MSWGLIGEHFISNMMWKVLPCLLCLTVAVWWVHGIDKRVFDVLGLPIQTLMLKAGDNMSIPCPGTNEHFLISSLSWLSVTHQVKVVEYNSETTTVWANQNRISLVPETYGLSLHPASGEDSGDYICLVNSRPKPEILVRLIVQDVPDPPGRPLIVSFTSRSVDLSWAPSQDTHHSAITHYIIHTRLGEDGDWNENIGVLTPTNQTNFKITNLHPYTVYSFRVLAVNGMGPSAPSKESYYMVTLREAPSGKPTITTAHNKSSSSIHLSWRPPHHDTIHGEFLGYRITYRPRDRGEDAFKEIYIRDPDVETHTIEDLETYTQYLVSLQVFNPEGHGPNTTVLVMTDEGVPTKPLNVTVLGITSGSIKLGWAEPEKVNGAIEGYYIYYIYANYTDVATYRLHGNIPKLQYNLKNLKPFAEYKVWVKAFTKKNDGMPSDPVINTTDVTGPSEPRLLNLTCKTEDTIRIEWERPAIYYNTLDFYYIYISGDDLSDNITIPASKNLTNTYILPNVSINTDYQVSVSASTRSLYSDELIMGKASEPKTISMFPECDKIQDFMKRATDDLSAGMVAGVICAGFAFLLAISAFVLWRKCFHAAYYYLDDPPCSVATAALDWNSPAELNGEVKSPIPITAFARHVAQLHADGDIAFSKEYETIQSEAAKEEFSAECSDHPDNKVKNRYLNITAYDHSRVALLQMPGQKKWMDYINANYIDGFQWNKAYIGTQGPLPSTFDAFWRMVWEQRVSIIVMITNLVERGRRKCDMYWPKDGQETYGIIQVKLVKEDIMATYTVRTLQIKHLKIKKKRAAMSEKLVYQYHYTSWPDHGTPDHPLPVLQFIKKSSAANPPDGGPIVVHCSAGVGRTGTYIVIDAMLRQIRTRNEANIFGFLRHIRRQRNYLVQTEEQYIFIHDAVLEAIESGETNIARDQFPKYVQTLQDNAMEERSLHWRSLVQQYNLVTTFQSRDYNVVSSNKPINLPKNRSGILPIETYRVHLSPKPGCDGSDYINASWIQGFRSLREFIITQHPMSHTVIAFWQMVWDHNAQTVVMLSIIDNEDFEVFWPVIPEVIEGETFKIRMVNETVHTTYVVREFIMQSLQDDYELTVKMIQCTNWPHHCPTVADMYIVPDAVQEIVGVQNGPIVIVDRYGGSEAGTFCSLVTLKKQVAYENYFDVYMYAKLYHNRRPGIWSSLDDFIRIHLAAKTLCSQEIAPDVYTLANGGAALNGTVANDCVRVPPEEAPLITTREVYTQSCSSSSTQYCVAHL